MDAKSEELESDALPDIRKFNTVQFYNYTKTKLDQEIAKKMFDEDIQGPDFLDMKPQDIERLFPKFGQKNRVNKLQNKFKHLTGKHQFSVDFSETGHLKKSADAEISGRFASVTSATSDTQITGITPACDNSSLPLRSELKADNGTHSYCYSNKSLQIVSSDTQPYGSDFQWHPEQSSISQETGIGTGHNFPGNSQIPPQREISSPNAPDNTAALATIPHGPFTKQYSFSHGQQLLQTQSLDEPLPEQKKLHSDKLEGAQSTLSPQTSGLAPSMPRLAEKIKSSSKCVQRGDMEIYELPKMLIASDKKKQIKITQVKSVHSDNMTSTSGDTEKVLMLVGATGAGKTTLINGMANYIYRVKWEDRFRFKLVEEHTLVSQANSQTTWITAYKFQKDVGSSLPYKFTVIDTPGFGDTQGIERDKIIVEQIKELFSRQDKDGIDHIDAVGFVVQSSLMRLTPTQTYIFDTILNVFGRDVNENVFAMCTFSDAKKPAVLTAIEAAQLPSFKNPDKPFFRFNNSAIFAENVASGEALDPSLNFNEMFWKMGMTSFKNFFNQLGRVTSKSLTLTREVLLEREHLEATIQGIQTQIRQGLSRMDELKQEEQVIWQHESEILANKDFAYQITVVKQQRVPLPRGVFITNCLKCNYSCHHHCKIQRDEEKYRCAAMDRKTRYCTVCPRKCIWHVHKNDGHQFLLYQEQEERCISHLMDGYETATFNKAVVNSLIEKIHAELKQIEERVLSLIVQTRASLERLNEIALKPDPLNELNYIDLLIQSEEEKADPGYEKIIQSLQRIRQLAEKLQHTKNPSHVSQYKIFGLPEDQRDSHRVSSRSRLNKQSTC